MINRMNSPLFQQGRAKWEAFVKEYKGPYDFSSSVYAGMNQKLTFVCPEHGAVTSDAKNLMHGKLCQQCMFAARKGRLRMTQKQMLQRFADVHGDMYDYSAAQYKGQQAPVSITCKEHGVFMQKPEFHWTGSGCPACFHQYKRGASQRDTEASFGQKVGALFGDLIDVSAVQYTNSQADIVVRCTKHQQDFPTRPNWLLNGNNPCPKCNHMKSKQESRIAQYLQTFTTVVPRDRSLIKPKELDIYLPEKKLAIEYCGMYWHSHFNAADEKADKGRHALKYRECLAQGVRLLTIYESEWQEREPALRRLLRNAVGKSRGRLMARKCELRKVETQDARAFYEKYHPQGGAGAGEHYALFWKGKMVACMRFSFGQNDRGAGAASRVWTLGRYATRVTVAGAASRLFKAFLAEHNPAEVKSFSDNRYFGGGMYEQLGFVLEADVPPDYQVWSPKIGIRPKPHYQRRVIPKRLLEHETNTTFDPDTDPRTEAQITYEMGCGRIYDCGKKRWVFRNVVDTPHVPE